MSAAAAPRAFARLRERFATLADLYQVDGVLEWDQLTGMPAAAAGLRGNQRATVTRLAHELLASRETGRLLERLDGRLEPGSFEAAFARVARRLHEKAVLVPPRLRAEIAAAESEALVRWEEAKRRSEFAVFLPALERTFELRRRYVERFADATDPYDVLLDDWEEGLTTAELVPLLQQLRDGLVPLLRACADREEDVRPRGRSFPVARQQRLVRELFQLVGLRPGTWATDVGPLAYLVGIGADDVRVAVPYHARTLQAIFLALHEAGHALYENQVAPELARTPLGSGASLGWHESQSRLWENLVGRGLPFWRFFFPRLRAAFPRALAGQRLESFVQEVNLVRPGPIRVAADEVSYTLHVVLRVELERDLLAGALAPSEVPSAWNERLEQYLGVRVESDAEGALQDVHWAAGLVGYFPTYALGNVLAVQLWERLLRDLPELDASLERGDAAPLREWLGRHLHRHGKLFAPRELQARLVGGLDAGPYLRYLRLKHGHGATALGEPSGGRAL